MPPPEKKTVTVPLGGKLEEGVDPKLLGRAGQFMARAESVQYDKHGLVSKCPGNAPQSYGVRGRSASTFAFEDVFSLDSESGRLTAGARIEVSGSSPETGWGQWYQALSYHSEEDEFHWMGGWPPVSQEVSKVSVGSDDMDDADGTVWDGYQWLAWTENGELWFSVKEVATGSVILNEPFPNAAANSYERVHMIPVDSYIHVFVQDGAIIKFIRIDTSIPHERHSSGGLNGVPKMFHVFAAGVFWLALPGAVIFVAAPRDVWDVCRVETGANKYSAIAWNDNAGGTVEVRYLADAYAGGAYAQTWNTGVNCQEAVTIAKVQDYNAAQDHLMMVWVNLANELRYITRDAANPGGVGLTGSTLILNMAAGGTDQDAMNLTASSCYTDAWVDGVANQNAVVWAQLRENDSAVANPLRSMAVYPWRVILNSFGGAGGIYPGPGGAGTNDYPWWNHELISKAWMHDGRSCVWMSHRNPDGGHAAVASQRGAVLATMGQKDQVTVQCHQLALATLHKDRFSHKAYLRNALPNVTETATGEYWWPCVTDDGENQQSATLNKVSFTQHGFLSARIGNNVLRSGGYISCDDGSMAPHGYWYYPQPQRPLGGNWVPTTHIITVYDPGANNPNPGDPAGQLYDNVDYSYVFTYEWVDKNGQWHVSESSVPYEVANPGGAGAQDARADMYITPHVPGWWEREHRYIYISVYRNTTTGAGVQPTEPYHLVGRVLNDPTSRQILFRDSMSDTNARTQPLLYTTGDVIVNTTPPPPRYMATHKNRVWVISDEDPADLWFSKEKAQNVATEFSNLLRIRMPEPCVAAASTPEALVVFAENNIYVVYGEGPGDTGVGTFYLPRKVSPGVGCTNYRSVKETAIGIVFQDGDDLYVIDGKLSPQKISGAVDDQLEGQTILSVIDDTDENRLKFIYNDGVGKYLVYDYEHDRWAEWSYRSDPAEDVTHGCLWNGDVYTMTDAFTLLKDTPGTYALDGYTTGPSMILETPWIDMGALTGLQRTWWIQLLGEWVSAHNMVVYVYFDYNKSAVISPIPVLKTFDCTTQKAPYILRMKPSHQKSKVIKVAIQEIPGGSVSRSVDLTAVEFICGFKTPKSTGFALSG